jgi:hypothetical protein
LAGNGKALHRLVMDSNVASRARFLRARFILRPDPVYERRVDRPSAETFPPLIGFSAAGALFGSGIVAFFPPLERATSISMSAASYIASFQNYVERMAKCDYVSSWRIRCPT